MATEPNSPTDSNVTDSGLGALNRRALLLLAAIFFLVGCYLGLFWWIETDEANKWFERHGNGASVLGLVFAISGFLFTIWTVLQTQAIEREARQREQKLEHQSQEVQRQVIDKARQEIEKSQHAIEKAQRETQTLLTRVTIQRLRELSESACDHLD